MNYKMILEYDGSKYNGWQRQGNTDNTIQGKLEEILSKYFEQDVEVNGSGRTDAGVHELGQVANFKVYSKKTATSSTEKIMYDLNNYLPEDIRIISLENVDERFHARLNAKQKTYRYTFCLDNKRSVFERKYCALLPDISLSNQKALMAEMCNLTENTFDVYNNNALSNSIIPDIELMRSASSVLLGEHDLQGFSDTKTKKSTIRRIDDITFEIKDINNSKYLIVEYTGNGFLYHTVRLLMGTLIQIGLHNCQPSIIEEILKTKDRKKVPYMAPAEGLTLVEVKY